MILTAPSANSADGMGSFVHIDIRIRFRTRNCEDHPMFPRLRHEPDLEELAAQHIAEIEANGATDDHLRQLRSVLAQFLAAAGVRRPSRLRREHAAAWFATTSEFKPSTRALYLGRVRHFCEWLVDSDHLAKNPCRGLRAPRNDPTACGSRAMSLDEVRRLIAHCPCDYRRAIYTLMATTGLRQGEIRKLPPDSRVDTCLHIPPRLTKNRRAAVIPLCDEARWALLELLAHPRFPKKVWKYQWDDDLRAARIATRGRVLTPHGLRKTYVTMLAAAGAQPAELQKFARHSSYRLTNDIYVDGQVLAESELVRNFPILGKKSPQQRAQRQPSR